VFGVALPSPDELNDLHLSACNNLRRIPKRLTDDLAIQFHRHPLRVNLEPAEQSEHAQTRRHSLGLPIHRDLNGLTPFLQRHTI
jgi:hypothetical protein